MPRLGPVKRRDLITYLRQLGFSDPQPGGNHEYMKRGHYRWLLSLTQVNSAWLKHLTYPMDTVFEAN